MWRPRSLAGRVALSVAFGSLLSGTIVAVVTGVLSNRIANGLEDEHLRDAARTLGFELTVKRYDPEYAAADEAQELAHTGILFAIFRDAHYVAGRTSIAYVEPGKCVEAAGARVCSIQAGPWVTIAARDSVRTREYRDVTTRAALIAVLLTSLIGAGVALALANAALKPLARLTNAVDNVPAHERAHADLGPDAGVSEVDALRRTLQSTFDRLHRALGQSRSFAGDAAHQLRTPLTAIIGELDLALETREESSSDEVQRARRVASRLSTLIDRLLILAGPDDAVRGATTVSLVDVVEDALDTLPEAARQRIDYQRDLIVEILGDPALLMSAILSALENSLKFSTGRVRVTMAADGEVARLAIEDDGPGLAESEREQVFAPFFRGREGRTGQVPGHGIGLAVIARVAAVHGGSARFVEREHGSRLEMTFARQA